jgi:uncharacterized iron-regulated membrane protein
MTAGPSTGLLAAFTAVAGLWFWMEHRKIRKRVAADPAYFRRRESRSQAITIGSLRNGAGIIFILAAISLILRLLGMY